MRAHPFLKAYDTSALLCRSVPAPFDVGGVTALPAPGDPPCGPAYRALADSRRQTLPDPRGDTDDYWEDW